ncbi:MAG: flagellar protein FliT [Rhodanobacter sp.]
MAPLPYTVASPLTEALVMTRGMLAAAKLADWDQLKSLEQTRAPLLHRPHPVDLVSRAQIEQILAYDLQLQAMLGNARDEVARQWQRARSGSQAITAYAQR